MSWGGIFNTEFWIDPVKPFGRGTWPAPGLRVKPAVRTVGGTRLSLRDITTSAEAVSAAPQHFARLSTASVVESWPASFSTVPIVFHIARFDNTIDSISRAFNISILPTLKANQV
jgi:hypothetical protein